ncbi:DUF4252 domain-containing protein [Barnesiella sp. An55]|uniref:DUF4252 domain-containing protein n=1 Tax=Barnesiella sp. An55 TaxID=1965646 RepID=UPI000B3947D8|nr:DUF4252 domain-containing protein [Barnesiella sp. An55]OUN74699.1 hypothetical protein B5G10_00280 [Barnesiella sp. An55]
MKRIIYVLLGCIIGLLPTRAQTNIFDQFANEKNITYVNISKTLLEMMPAGQLEVDALDLKSVINELDRIQILTCEDDANLINRIRKASSSFKKAPYEELMKVKDDDEMVTIYIYPQPQKKIKELIMLVDDGGEEFVVIQLTGNISISHLQSLTKNIE